MKNKGPFIKEKNNVEIIMRHLFISLIPIIIFAFYKNGIYLYYKNQISLLEMFYPLFFIMIGSLSSCVFEKVYYYVKKENKNSYSIFPGLFLSLVLPINTPIILLILGSFIAVFVGKILFGGFGHNIFNPALIGCLFVIIIYGAIISNNGGYLNKYEQITTGATPLSNASGNEIGNYNELVQPYGGLLNFGIGMIPGTLGETSSILCLLSLIYLLIFKVIKWQIPVIYILTVFGMTYMIGSLNNLTVWYPLFQIMSGGLLFGAVFMATDPITSPVTPIGQTLYGLFLGILTVMIRYLTPYPEGVLTSILTLNMFVFIFDKIGMRARFKFKQATIYFIVAWILIIGLSIYIGKGSSVEQDFKVISVKSENNLTIYEVSQKGFSGNIEAKITFNKENIEEVKIIKINDDYYPKIKEEKYIDKLLSSNIEEVDTISGATITSNAIKKLIIKTKEYHE